MTGGFLALSLFVLYQALTIFSPFFHSMFWGGLLAFAFFPVYRWIRQRGLSERMAASLVTIALALIVLVPVSLLLVQLASQAGEWAKEARAFLEGDGLSEWIAWATEQAQAKTPPDWRVNWHALQRDAQSWLEGTATEVGNYAMGRMGSMTKNILVGGFHALLTIWLLYTFLKTGTQLARTAYQLTPLPVQHKRTLFEQLNDTLAAVIRGQLFTAASQAAVAGVAFLIVGVPYPLLFGALTFFFALLPVVGAGAVWVPLTLWLAAQQSYTQAAILFVLGVGGISLIDNLVRPWLIAGKTGLPYLLLFLSILGGMRAYGLSGLFIGPVVFSILFVLIKIYRQEYTRAGAA